MPEPLDVQSRMDVVMTGAQFFIAMPPVEDLLANIERAHALAPILDPTAYRGGAHNLRWQQTVLRAVQRFQKDLEPIRELIDAELGR